MRPLPPLLVACAAALSAGLVVTLRNDVPRVDTTGAIIDAHSGNIVYAKGRYFMVGEHYGNTTGFGPSPPALFPKLVIYSSPDMSAWRFEGFALSGVGPYGTFFTPWLLYNERTDTFVLWFNAYIHGCCEGNWGVATSRNGTSFDVISLNTSGAFAVVDCNALFVDDDGSAYLFYTSEAQDHKQSIEKLNDEWTGLAGENFGLFPDRYVEGGVLFKRGDTYYASYGSCCCFCRGGSGVVVYSAPSIRGPWVRQPLDVNCNSTVPGDICGAYGDRVTDDITVAAQGIGLSRIPLAGGGEALLWHGERWLSARGNNPQCPDECRPETGICAEPEDYVKGEGYSYWVPLSFDASGNVKKFELFVDAFSLDVLVA